MQFLNSKEKEIVGMLNDFGLCEYKARMYFTLLTIGEIKISDLTSKPSVLQSKA